jgi:hypothetical protein
MRLGRGIGQPTDDEVMWLEPVESTPDDWGQIRDTTCFARAVAISFSSVLLRYFYERAVHAADDGGL